MSRYRVLHVLWIALGVVVIFCLSYPLAISDDKKDAALKSPPFGAAFIRPQIVTGSPSDTIAYYSQIGPALGLPLITSGAGGAPNLNPRFTIDQLNAFAGFSDGKGGGLLAVDLDSVAGSTLSDPTALAGAVSNPAQFQAFFKAKNLVAGELQAASFFAPKICNVGAINGSTAATEPDKYGWRKVVLLRPRDGSPAKAKNVTGVWLLFNYFVPKASVLGSALTLKGSVNTQSMLQFATVQTTPSVTGGSPDKDAAYWLDFEEKTNALTAALNASFDSGEGDLGATGGTQNYYVPTACAVCHGGSRTHAALNVLDTDHWFERVRKAAPAGIDFPSMSDNADNGVLLDAGPDLTKPKFKTGFDVFRKLNAEVLSQNTMSGATIQPASTKHWVDKHTSSDTPLSLADRSLGASPWTAADSNVLSYLDRYCYRCHNAVRYNVFDKNAVLFERSQMISRLQLDWVESNYQIVMPQDRHLDPKIVQPLINLLNAVKP
jgi:hypothetical protein